ncbi:MULTISPECIES: hypothetical protein [Xanthomonas]|uniref:hypothetical protein n=1 Tax=Xanthomonas TaxID=338 RepID=UPI001AF8A02E|nr:hypothetical protein [Xanthomonas euvesicatoria]MCC8614446.1 hypothetical protein [Xanthomonas euvesicatoria pv. euvesicatoria]CAD7740545.1 hypothetical protein LMG31884_46800 [Xanthomonas hydrangeae]CAD7740549.1 hypothetical protein LMG31884_46800 [Xanthomonas hydrangeae]
MNITGDAASRFPLAETAQSFSVVQYMWVISAVVLAMTLLAFTMTLIPAKKAATSSAAAIIMAAFSMLAGNDLKNARLYDAQALPLPAVSSAVVTGGGCTPVRTVLKLSSQEEVTVSGSMGLNPGEIISRKIIGEKSYVCRGTEHTVDCKAVD